MDYKEKPEPEDRKPESDDKRLDPALAAVKPWRDMFLRPGDSSRSLAATETQREAFMMWLSMTALMIAMLFLNVMLDGDRPEAAQDRLKLLKMTLPLFLISATYYVAESQLLWYILRLFGGNASKETVRIVYSFTNVIPAAVFLVVDFFLSAVLPRDGFLMKTLGQVTLCWSIYITAAGLAAVSGVRIWRAAGAYVATFLAWIVAFAALGLVLRGIGMGLQLLG